MTGGSGNITRRMPADVGSERPGGRRKSREGDLRRREVKLAGVRGDEAGDWMRPLASSEASSRSPEEGEEEVSYHHTGSE